MRKEEKHEFYACVDEIKFLIEKNKVLAQKDINIIENEIIIIKGMLKDKYCR